MQVKMLKGQAEQKKARTKFGPETYLAADLEKEAKNDALTHCPAEPRTRSL